MNIGNDRHARRADDLPQPRFVWAPARSSRAERRSIGAAARSSCDDGAFKSCQHAFKSCSGAGTLVRGVFNSLPGAFKSRRCIFVKFYASRGCFRRLRMSSRKGGVPLVAEANDIAGSSPERHIQRYLFRGSPRWTRGISRRLVQPRCCSRSRRFCSCRHEQSRRCRTRHDARERLLERAVACERYHCGLCPLGEFL